MDLPAPGLADTLRAVLGAAHVRTDPAALDIFANDIAGPAACPPDMVVAPGTVDELQRVMREAAAAGRAVVPRGGGMSYTGGYGPAQPGAVLLDLRRLDRVVAVHARDRVVVVEAGCTWGALHQALGAHGLRLASFGPLSGDAATVGGGLSQHAMFFGAGTAGLVTEAVLGLDMVLADGRLLGTGAMARPAGPPFFRQVAPDLTGLFLGDAGAFGVKARAALRLVRAPAAERYASFAFPDVAAMVAAQLAVAALDLAAECYGFDTVANRHLRERGFGAAGSVAVAAELAVASRNPLDAARALLQAGATRLARDDAPAATLHVVTEAETTEAASARIGAIRAAIGRAGREVADTVPRVTRAKPFRRIRALLGPAGQNWLPVHGILPASAAAPAVAALGRYLETHSERFAAHRIEVAVLTATSPGALLIEPQFFWFDALNPLLRDAILPEQRAAHGDRPPDPAARAIVHEARAAIRDLLDAAGAVHIQPGKYYPLPLAPDAAAALQAMKRAFDPDGRMNPGALGLT